MKLLLFTWMEIKSFVLHQKSLFIIFFSGMILSLLLVVLYCGYQITNQYEIYKSETGSRMYKYTVDDVGDWSALCEGIYSSGSAGAIVLTAKATLISGDVSAEMTMPVSAWYPNNQTAEKYVYLGRYWNNDETASVCVGSSHYFNELPPDSVMINGRAFSMIGISAAGDLSTYILIPINKFIQMRFDNVTLNVLPSDTASFSEIKALDTHIKESYRISSSKLPEVTADWFDWNGFFSSIAKQLLIIILSVLSYMIIYRYICQKRTETYIICRLVGSGFGFTVGNICLELALYSAAAYLFGMIIACLLKNIWDITGNLSVGQIFLAGLPALALVLVVSLLIALPVVLIFIRKDVGQAYSKR